MIDEILYPRDEILGTNYAVPISEQGGSILDVATGTGRWAHEMARAFPQAKVIGLDMEASRETYEPPANYQFVPRPLVSPLAHGEDVSELCLNKTF